MDPLKSARAESSAEVVLASDGICLLEALDEAIRVESSAVVDLQDCADVVIVDDDFDDDDGLEDDD